MPTLYNNNLDQIIWKGPYHSFNTRGPPINIQHHSIPVMNSVCFEFYHRLSREHHGPLSNSSYIVHFVAKHVQVVAYLGHLYPKRPPKIIYPSLHSIKFICQGFILWAAMGWWRPKIIFSMLHCCAFAVVV